MNGSNEIKIGDKFGHWTVIGDSIVNGKSHHKEYLCECDCLKKTQKYVDAQNLKKGKSLSCGCETAKSAKIRFTKHGENGTRLFNIWCSMKQRCSDPHCGCYDRYGGRGITVCQEWQDSFVSFRDWSLTHGYKDDLSIDRINNDKGYNPDNCRWATVKEQNNNRRSNVHITYNGQTHNIQEWSKITGIKRQKIADRFHKGYPLEDVFFCGNFNSKGKRIL